MKKSKLSFGLVTSFIAAMSLSACGSNVTSKKDALVTFKPYGEGETIDIVTDEMYQKYHKTTDGISKFYSQILEVLIRYEFEKNDGQNGMLTLAEIKQKAKSDVKQEKQNARDKGNYDTEWKNILDSYDVENEKELTEYFIYKHEKDEISKYFLNNNIETLRKEFIGVDQTGAPVESKVDTALPYHIRHILVKTDASASDFVNSTISATEANKLYNVISKLKDGKLSFAQIAYDESDDGSGKEAYGDVGIVTNQINESTGKLTMVNEFQLGIYAYDAILSGKSNEAISKGLGLEGKYKTSDKTIKETYAATTGLVKVPYDAIAKLYEYKDLEKDEYGNELSDGNPVVYPRNIIWNKYFNHHQAFVITNAARNEGTNANGGAKTAVESAVAQFKNIASTSTFDANLGDRFVNIPAICSNANEKVLTDGNGNFIIGVRSEFGIHLIVIQKSIYDFANSNVTLEEYYTTEVPGSSKYPVDASGKAKNTYVNFINSSATTDYNKRANKVKDTIKAFDSTYDYRLYESLVDKYQSQIKFAGEEGNKLNDAIARYLSVTRGAKAHTQESKLNAVWEEYIEMLTLQNDKREQYYETGANEYKSLMIPEGCAVNFKHGGDDYKEGGKCYYAK